MSQPDASLLDAALLEAQRPNPGPRCWFSRQPADVQTVLERHFLRDVTNQTISDGLRTIGIEIGSQRVRWHRSGRCSCPRRS